MFKIIARAIAIGLFLCLMSVVIIVLQLHVQPKHYIFKDAAWDSLETAGRLEATPAKTTIVGQIESSRDIDYLTITVTKPQEIVLHLQSFAENVSFTPELVLFGRGLPKSKNMDIPIGDGNGAIVGNISTEAYLKRNIFDPLTMTSYTDGPQIRTTLPAAGTYAVMIRAPKGGWGRYTLTNGTAPDQSLDGWWSLFIGSLRMILRLY